MDLWSLGCVDGCRSFMDAAFFASGLAPSDDDLVVGVVEDAGPADNFMVGFDVFSGGEFTGEFLAVADYSGLLVSSFDDGVLPSAALA